MLATAADGSSKRIRARREIVLCAGAIGSPQLLQLSGIGPAAELASLDLELIWAPVPFIDHGSVKPTGHDVSIGVVLLTPHSRGRISLGSADPGVPPRIAPRYLSDERDLATFVKGVRHAQRLLPTRAVPTITRGIRTRPRA